MPELPEEMSDLELLAAVRDRIDFDAGPRPQNEGWYSAPMRAVLDEIDRRLQDLGEVGTGLELRGMPQPAVLLARALLHITLSRDDALVLVGGLNRLRRKHYECEDCWYSCPKSEEGCCNDNMGDDCTCGADTHNALIDALLALIPVEVPRAE